MKRANRGKTVNRPRHRRPLFRIVSPLDAKLATIGRTVGARDRGSTNRGCLDSWKHTSRLPLAACHVAFAVIDE